jgi:adiponectin receptor
MAAAIDTAKDAATAVASASKQAEAKLEQKLTYLWHEISPWQQDNAYIHSGYRPASNSFAKSWQSLGYLHNETVNIYSHLLGAVLAFVSSGILYTTLAPRYPTASRDDVYVFSCFFFGAVACLGMSATYHTISNHSHEVAVLGNKLDYLGIVFLIWGSFIPVLYYAFQSEPALMRTYWAMVRLFHPTTSVNATLLTPRTDHHPRSPHLGSLYPPAIPHPGSAPLPRPPLRPHGYVSRVSRPARHPPVRRRAYA